MELAVYGVLGLAVIVAVAAFSRRLGVAAPIILIVVGVGLSYLPIAPHGVVPPELVLDGLLPPILYAAAIRVPVIDLRRNFNAIVSLSFVLVVVTAFGVGFLLYAELPALGLAEAIALGAIISPPDAVAATSVGRRLGLPPRLLTVLEGEGLVNDATALVLFRSALAVALSGVFDPWASALDFVYAVSVAVVFGLVVGFVTVRVRSWLDDPVLDTAISIAVPFVAFVTAESVHASGVLAVVVAGLYTGHANPSRFSAQARASDLVNWRSIQFILENSVFLLIGLELRTLIEDVDPAALGTEGAIGVSQAVLIGLVATAALIAIRFLWIGPLIGWLALRTRLEERAVYRDKLALDHLLHVAPLAGAPVNRVRARWRRGAELRYERRRADLEQLRREAIDWRGGVVLSWSGMRGVVTLAAAQSLPSDVPYRPQLVLIAFTVAFVTLVVQGGTLPALIRLLRIRGVDDSEDRRALAALLDEISEAGLAVLDDPAAAIEGVDEIEPDVVDRVRQSSFVRAESAWERLRGLEAPLEETPHRLYRRLRLAVVLAERERLLEIRKTGTYPSRIQQQAQAMLDLEETRLRPLRSDH